MRRTVSLFLLIILLTSSVAFSPASARDVFSPPGQSLAPEDPPNPVYLPLLFRSLPTYAVTGQVTDQQATPLPGVTIADSAGHTAVTNSDGAYSMYVPQGDYALAPIADGYMFTPSMVDVSVTGDITNQDFMAVAVCNEAFYNNSFEVSEWWNLLEVNYPATYSSTQVHSGLRSVRTGIADWWDNRWGYSSLRSPVMVIPAGAGSVTLRLWIYPESTEAITAPETPEMAEAISPGFGDTTMVFDAQYVQVLDASDNLIETLMWIRSDNRAWSFLTFDLTRYAGQSIKLQFGTYNDGTEGITALYIDDVSLQICDNTPPPPPPPGSCVNQVDNSSFEYTGAWGIPNTPYPAAYSNDYAYAGSRSMRTGIPLYASANRYSYSDAWQTVYIPANATSATLHLRLYPRSAESGASSPEEVPESQASELVGAPEPGTLWGEAPLASDAQYLLILNPNTGNIIDTLLWWSPKNASNWLYREYDLLRYAGRSIRIQFGTYNNGYGGRSVMYVDQVRVDTCTSAPPPPPPPACTERLSNGGFENNSAWYIPLTAFTAGYSTYREHSGWRSMRTGIVYWYHNRYSYSDFRQAVSIPSTATSAMLSMWLFNTSGEGYGMPDPARPTSPENGQDAAAGDVQYLLVLDRWGNWYDTLFWQRNNDQYWRYYQFNLLRFAGQTIMLQWGTYNNGWGGVTSMYVDDASLVTCP